MKQRIISAMVGLAILIVVMLLYQTIAFNIAISLVSALAVFELLHATGYVKIQTGAFSLVGIRHDRAFFQHHGSSGNADLCDLGVSDFTVCLSFGRTSENSVSGDCHFLFHFPVGTVGPCSGSVAA